MNGATIFSTVALLAAFLAFAVIYAARWYRSSGRGVPEPRVPTNAERIYRWQRKDGRHHWQVSRLQELSVLESASGPANTGLTDNTPQGRSALSMCWLSAR